MNYGLKNNGVKRAIQRIASLRHVRVPLWISIAKTNCTRTCDLEQGIRDYQESLRLLTESQLGDAYVINISCPNAFGGEDFTAPERLTQLLSALDQIIHRKPVLIKLPVDAARLKIQTLLDVCIAHKIHGVIISNLTKVRDAIVEKDDIQAIP